MKMNWIPVISVSSLSEIKKITFLKPKLFLIHLKVINYRMEKGYKEI